jgi:hypothetical protein
MATAASDESSNIFPVQVAACAGNLIDCHRSREPPNGSQFAHLLQTFVNPIFTTAA